jgi:hypothetical protein
MKRLTIIVAVAAIGVGAPIAAAGAPESPSCWGAASAEFAQSEPGALGEHASNPPDVDLGLDRPGRAGIGNVARILGVDHPSELAAALGATCP